MFFSPVCFLPCLAACPDVVKVSVQLWRTACGHGYFFFARGVLRAEAVSVAFAEVVGVLGSDLMVDVIGGRQLEGVWLEVAEDGVGSMGEVFVL